MFRKSSMIKGTLILTVGSLIARILGFLYRIFLSNLIGAKGMGIFQLIFPVLTFCVALSSGGIQIAVSRFVAESNSRSKQFLILVSSIIMSLTLSAFTGMILYYYAEPISENIIKNSECTLLLRYSSLTIPLCAFHACVSGYYLGFKKAFVPAWSAVFEQIVKVISLYIIGFIWIQSHIAITPMIAVYSTILSEFGGAVFCMIAVCSEKKYAIQLRDLFHTMQGMFSVSYILTLNRIMLTFLQCAEAILVPIVLIKSGISKSDSLSIYGILTGMALPVVTFPSAINASLSTMLLPSIAKANTSKNSLGLKYTTEASIWFSMATGIFCIGFFLFFGDFIGTTIFGHQAAGEYIEILAWLCPFLYLSMTLGSVLHGIGKTWAAFIHNAIGIIIRLAFLWLSVPKIGILGYLWGMLISNLVTTLCHAIYVKKYIPIKFCVSDNIIKPTAWLLTSLAVGYLVQYIFRFCDISGRLFYYTTEGISAVFICIIFAYFFIRYQNEQK